MLRQNVFQSHAFEPKKTVEQNKKNCKHEKVDHAIGLVSIAQNKHEMLKENKGVINYDVYKTCYTIKNCTYVIASEMLENLDAMSRMQERMIVSSFTRLAQKSLWT